MNWGSAGEFFAMGGYGLYVWGSYGAALVALVVEPWLAARQHRRALAALADASFEEAQEAPGDAAPSMES
ncbi:MAG: heme exporter protein CcmD [Burkholderiales bacterium]|nr:heme exporter protein CcmD [Burkholderiales bacterium]